jgi:hypothetical protein
MDWDFGDGTNSNPVNGGDDSIKIDEKKSNIGGPVPPPDDDITELDVNTGGNVTPEKEPDKGNDTPPVASDYEEGTVIEVDDVTYTIDAKGNAVDKDGNIFKEVKDVSEWIKSLNDSTPGDNTDNLSVSALKELFDVEVTDDNDRPIEFTDTKEGRQEYINAVLEATREESASATIQALYNKYPFIEQAIAYYVTNGNSLDGFGVVQDRSSITIDPNNTEQQESIIKSAWKERGQKGDADAYIQYLKANNLLKDTAEAELEGLKEKDVETKEALNKKAEEAEKTRIENEKTYWNNVKSVIENKVIAGYKIPDTIIIEKDGKKITASPNDFFNYLYQIDKTTGRSRYENELIAEAPEKRLNDELLAAYIKFSGGSYSSLVNMAIHDKNIKTLKLTAKKTQTTKVTPRPPKKPDASNVDLGFD